MYGGNQSAQQLLATGVLFGIAHSFTLWAGAAVVRRYLIYAQPHMLPRIVLVFLLAGSLSALAAALAGAWSLVLTEAMTLQEFYHGWLPWWIGDMVGIFIIAPLCLAILGWKYPALERFFSGLQPETDAPLLHFVWKLAIIGGGISIALLIAAAYRNEEAVFLAFFLIIPMMWIAYSESPLRTTISLAVLSALIAIWVKALGLIDYAMVYQFAIIITAATTYLGLTVPVLTVNNQRLHHQANMDFLTGLWSRRFFVECAEQEIERAHRYSQPLSLIHFDIDKFKDINDHFGHSTGDEVLREIGTCVLRLLRQSDMAARYGGDEFVVLLPGTELEEATQTAERIRYALQTDTNVDDIDGIQVSLGVVQLGSKENMASLINRADRAMLEAKRSGRHRTVANAL